MKPQTEFQYDFFKESYYFQIERLESLRERIAFIGGHLLLLGGGIYYLPLNYVSQGRPSLDITFWTTIALAILLFGIAVGLVLYSLARGFKYKAIAPPLTLYNHVEQVALRNEKIPENERIDLEEHMKSNLALQYAKCADHNLRLNTSRGEKLITATKSAIFSSILLLLAAVPFFWAKAKNPQKPTIVVISEHQGISP